MWSTASVRSSRKEKRKVTMHKQQCILGHVLRRANYELRKIRNSGLSKWYFSSAVSINVNWPTLTRQNWQIPVNELTQISVRGHSALMQLKHVNVALTLTALYISNTGLKTIKLLCMFHSWKTILLLSYTRPHWTEGLHHLQKGVLPPFSLKPLSL